MKPPVKMSTMMAKQFFAASMLVLLGLLASCGGGGSGSPSVATMTASAAPSIQFGRTLVVAINGTSLTEGELRMVVDGPCVDIAQASGGTDLQMQFTCRIVGVGDLIARIRTSGGAELASLRGINVPLPRVSMTVAQGARSGSFVLELDPVAAPITVENFLAYVNAGTNGGFYRNTLFHRVVADFVAQAGGYTNGPTVKAPTRTAIKLEANNGLKNLRGTIAMARQAEPDSATSQFYLNLADNPSLDFGSAENPAGYAVFGKVISGLDIVDEIGKVEVVANPSAGLTHLPVVNVVITGGSQIR